MSMLHRSWRCALVTAFVLYGAHILADAKFTSTWGAPEARGTSFKGRKVAALVVSEGYHLLRASWIFSAEGIDASFSPATEPTPFFNQIYSIAREIVALHWQALKTVLGLPVRFVPWL